MKVNIAHYYCELAESSLARDDIKVANAYLRHAEKADETSPRVCLLFATILINENHFEKALGYLNRLVQHHVELIPEALSALETCYRHLEQLPSLETCLIELIELAPHHRLLTLLIEQLTASRGEKATQTWLAEFLARHPSLHGLKRYVQLTVACTEHDTKQELNILQSLMQRLLGSQSDYQCSSCGFLGKHLYWQCPGCKLWSTVKPLMEQA